jgi:hypothetical protein
MDYVVIFNVHVPRTLASMRTETSMLLYSICLFPITDGNIETNKKPEKPDVH